MIKLAGKFKNAKTALKNWNREVFGRVDQNIKALELVELKETLQRGYAKEIEVDFLITKCELDCWENGTHYSMFH